MELLKSTRDTLTSALRMLTSANIPFLVGGAFAVEHYTGHMRNTKDIDIFLRKRDVDQSMAKLTEAGFRTRIESAHWLAKAFKGDNLVDLIYGAGNWVWQVDDTFFDRSISGRVLGVPVRLLAPEEIIWSKAYVAARERFDGADIVHLISTTAARMDWNHLLARYGEDWQLLLADLLLYDFVYPSQRDYIPHWLRDELAGRMQVTLKAPPPPEKACRGTLLDIYSFLNDIDVQGYRDPREELAKKQGFAPAVVEAERVRARAVVEAALK